MDSLKTYALLALLLFANQSIWFVVALLKKRNDVADVAWGLGFVWIAWWAFLFGNGNERSLLVNALATVWGVRLAAHIHVRNRGKSEDFRYAQWRREWKNFYVRSFLQVFMLQGFFLFVIAWPVIWTNLEAQAEWQVWDFAGVLVWIIGFGFESVGDHQLSRFKKNPANKGKIITSGLWRYTRHPNYFGEAVLWWGIFMIACSAGGWFTIVSPLMITFLLRFVSGVPMLERKYASHPDFEAYKSTTNVFFPMPPGSDRTLSP
jgi:steroid 5-alpha reductase family enzyme